MHRKVEEALEARQAVIDKKLMEDSVITHMYQNKSLVIDSSMTPITISTSSGSSSLGYGNLSNYSFKLSNTYSNGINEQGYNEPISNDQLMLEIGQIEKAIETLNEKVVELKRRVYIKEEDKIERRTLIKNK